MELLRATPDVIDELEALQPDRGDLIRRHTLLTTEGMAGFLERSDEKGHLKLRDEGDLRSYCYIVAGSVGDMLTELMLKAEPSLASSSAILRRNARAFGEGLQLVNILRDSTEDARHGRVYAPASVDRGALLTLARGDLRDAQEYVRVLQAAGGPPGFVAFTALPVMLALATLDLVEQRGAGAKMKKADVASLMARLTGDLRAGNPVFG